MAEKKPIADYAGQLKELQSGDSIAGLGVTVQAEPPTSGLWFSSGVYSETALFLQVNGTWRRAHNGTHLPDAKRCHRVDTYSGRNVLSRGRVKASKTYKHLMYL